MEAKYIERAISDYSPDSFSICFIKSHWQTVIRGSQSWAVFRSHAAWTDSTPMYLCNTLTKHTTDVCLVRSGFASIVSAHTTCAYNQINWTYKTGHKSGHKSGCFTGPNSGCCPISTNPNWLHTMHKLPYRSFYPPPFPVSFEEIRLCTHRFSSLEHFWKANSLMLRIWFPCIILMWWNIIMINFIISFIIIIAWSCYQ